MAWSDAARAAAAEARKMHAKAKTAVAGKGEQVLHKEFMAGAPTAQFRSGSGMRNSLAQRVQEIRHAKFLVSSRGKLTPGGQFVIKSAAANTEVRNHLRAAQAASQGHGTAFNPRGGKK